MKLVLIMFCLIVGHWFGWHGAHSDIAVECDRQGGFFVGNRVYSCHLKEIHDAKN